MYSVELSDIEKSAIKPVLTKFNFYKQRKYGKHTVDYDSLVEMADIEKSALEFEVNDIEDDEKLQNSTKTFKS